MLTKRSSQAPKKWRWSAKRQFEAVCPQMLGLGEVLATPTLEDLVHATKWPELHTTVLSRRRSPRCRSVSGSKTTLPAETKVKSRLVATEVAYGNRDDCFAGTLPQRALRLVVSLAASTGRILAFFDVVASFVHALIDELVILLWPGGLGH